VTLKELRKLQRKGLTRKYGWNIDPTQYVDACIRAEKEKK
jgi:hypothetical protein